MQVYEKLYIDGKWITSNSTASIEVTNPTNEQVIGKVPAGDTSDVDLAVGAAKKAFQNQETVSASSTFPDSKTKTPISLLTTLYTTSNPGNKNFAPENKIRNLSRTITNEEKQQHSVLFFIQHKILCKNIDLSMFNNT